MNSTRRKELARISAALDSLRSDLEAVGSEEQEAFDSMPESLKQSERGIQAETAASTIADALSNIDEAISNIDIAQE